MHGLLQRGHWDKITMRLLSGRRTAGTLRELGPHSSAHPQSESGAGQSGCGHLVQARYSVPIVVERRMWNTARVVIGFIATSVAAILGPHLLAWLLEKLIDAYESGTTEWFVGNAIVISGIALTIQWAMRSENARPEHAVGASPSCVKCRGRAVRNAFKFDLRRLA